jgi:hypothetical protein
VLPFVLSVQSTQLLFPSPQAVSVPMTPHVLVESLLQQEPDAH